MPALLSSIVTLLFADIECSAQLLHRFGPDYAQARGLRQAVLRAAFAAHRGVEVDTQGDAFFAAFPTAAPPVGAAAQATRELVLERLEASGGEGDADPTR